MERGERTLEAEGRLWRAVDAWRASSGLGLAYFLPLEAKEEPAADDREDRRAVLQPGESVAELDPEILRDRLAGGTRLTATERRFRAPDGRVWLVQSVGPVWAEGTASGLTGLLFTALEGPAGRIRSDGGHVGEMKEAELERRWRRAAEDSGSEGNGDGRDASSSAEADGEPGRSAEAGR